MDLLERLVSTFSVSGNEGAVRKLIKSEIEKYVDEIYIDRLGNLIAHKKGKTDHLLTVIKKVFQDRWHRLHNASRRKSSHRNKEKNNARCNNNW